jgi:hypothetical protein
MTSLLLDVTAALDTGDRALMLGSDGCKRAAKRAIEAIADHFEEFHECYNKGCHGCPAELASHCTWVIDGLGPQLCYDIPEILDDLLKEGL